MDFDWRIVNHRIAVRESVRQRGAFEPLRQGDVALGFEQFIRGNQLARRHQFGQHHGDGLQRLDFVFGVGARGAVLHREHADDGAGAQHRHAEE